MFLNNCHNTPKRERRRERERERDLLFSIFMRTQGYA